MLPLLCVIAVVMLPGDKMADIDPFPTLMAVDVIPHVYPVTDDKLAGDLPFPGEKDALYAVLTALETKLTLMSARRMLTPLSH